MVVWALATITCLIIGEENYSAVIVPPVVSTISLVIFAIIYKGEIGK